MKRIVAALGLIWVVYVLFTHFVLVPPGPGAPPQDILGYLHYNFNAISITTYWGIVVTVLFFLFGSCLVTTSRGHDEIANRTLTTLATGGLLAYVILSLASQAILLSISYYLPEAQSPILILAGYQVYWAIDPAVVALLTLAIFMAGTAFIGLRNRTMIRSLSWSGLGLAALTALGTLFILWSPLSVLISIVEILVPLWFAAAAISLMIELPKPVPGVPVDSSDMEEPKPEEPVPES